jgi:hypothetical protein
MVSFTGLPKKRTNRLLLLTILLLSWRDSEMVVEGFSLYRSSFPSLRAASRRTSIRIRNALPDGDIPQDNIQHEIIDSETTEPREKSRRMALQGIIFLSAAAIPTSAMAGKPELDSTGQLFTPKAQMLSGGSAAARGIKVDSRSKGARLMPGQALQTVYEPRFITYLSRFLLKYDPAANAYWTKNSPSGGWDKELESGRTPAEQDKIDSQFAEFAESVEIGLSDYFVGPYGSYSSLSAMKAGIAATAPARSERAYEESWLDHFFSRGTKKKTKNREDVSKQGILNLYALLKARYTSISAKRQLAILFSFISNPKLQPTAEIRSLLGEADNVTITKIDFITPFCRSEATSRTSSQRGGGYSVNDQPRIIVGPPPALGAAYKPAKTTPVMQLTSRVLRIRVVDGGKGYTSPPEVSISLGATSQQCEACAILDREGRVESVLVLNPGYGYGKKLEAPKVFISSPPKGSGKNAEEFRKAKAIAELEYEIVGINIVQGGNGYAASEPPKVLISPPEEFPDWYVDVPELAVLQSEFGPIRAEVAQMRFANGLLAYSIGRVRRSINLPLKSLRDDPLELLPYAVRPQFENGYYTIPELAAYPTYSNLPSERYRAVDPVFGSIGTLPVTKGALELNTGEYARLALSGAFCTVVVRTALNPLELIKTKQQLKNDKELFDFARQSTNKRNADLPAGSSVPTPPPNSGKIDSTVDAATEAESTVLTVLNVTTSSEPTNVGTTETSESGVGTVDLIASTIKLRGPVSLFQSADITFLASLIFGSLGFGATELFRRSFTVALFTESGGDVGSELILLLAATVATVITSAAATPFEVLRVRSMGLVESKKWTEVLKDFLDERTSTEYDSSSSASSGDDRKEFVLTDLNPRDVFPLWAGFAPTCSRELAFAIPKFLVFDVFAKGISGFVNSQVGSGALPVQVGVGTEGLVISAVAGAFAGIAGGLVSHPFDLILTKMSASKKKAGAEGEADDSAGDWREVVKELLSREGGVANLFLGLAPRLTFFFLVIGLQFFLYDYVKNILQVGYEDLSLVMDVFYAVRKGLI